MALKERLIKETEADLRAQFLTAKTARSFSITQQSTTIRNSKSVPSRSAIEPAQMSENQVKDQVLGAYKQNKMKSNNFTSSLLNTKCTNVKDIAPKHQ